jgi:F-type H+-transporting ATPase subunit b
MNPLATPALAAGITELNPGLTLWVAITFLVLIVVLAKVAWGPIVKMLDDRERTIRDAIEQARKEREEAERMMAQQKEALARAHREAAELAKRSQAEMEAFRAELAGKAKKEADDLVASARRQIEEEKVKAVAEIKGQTVDLAIAAAGRILKVGLDDKAQRALVEEYIAQLPASRS